MRRDLLIALFVSVLVHGWLALGFNTKPPPLIPDAPPPPTIEISLPPPEAEDVPLADSSDQPPADPAPAPPMQADLPSVNLDTPFVQPIQPFPPPTLGRPVGLITIPSSGGTGSGLGSVLGAIFDLASLDQRPSTRYDAVPHYPDAMKSAGISGEVEVGFIIDTEGAPHDAYVIRSSQREFESAALNAVSLSKFVPGKKGGRVVNTRVRRIIVFSLDAN